MAKASAGMSKYAHKVRKPYPTLYHISFNEELQGVWQPKSPDGDYDDSGDDALYGEPTTPAFHFRRQWNKPFKRCTPT